VSWRLDECHSLKSRWKEAGIYGKNRRLNVTVVNGHKDGRLASVVGAPTEPAKLLNCSFSFLRNQLSYMAKVIKLILK
jgi:hypothetical protein